MHKSVNVLSSIVFVCVFVTGCGTVRTVHPIRTSDKTIRDPEIEGVWKSRPDDPTYRNDSLHESVLTIKRVGVKKYRVTLQRDYDSYDGHAYLVELGERKFLEFNLESISRHGEITARSTDLPGNTIDTLFFVRVHRTGDRMRIGFPRVEAFKEASKSSEDLDGVERDKSFIITSTTEQLQRFLATANDSMYRSDEVFVRLDPREDVE